MSRKLKNVLNHWIFCKPAAEQAVGITDVITTAATTATAAAAAVAAAAATTRLINHS